MTDYFDVNFYFFDCKTDYDYKVVENKKFDIEMIKADFDTVNLIFVLSLRPVGRRIE